LKPSVPVNVPSPQKPDPRKPALPVHKPFAPAVDDYYYYYYYTPTGY